MKFYGEKWNLKRKKLTFWHFQIEIKSHFLNIYFSYPTFDSKQINTRKRKLTVADILRLIILLFLQPFSDCFISCFYFPNLLLSMAKHNVLSARFGTKITFCQAFLTRATLPHLQILNIMIKGVSLFLKNYFWWKCFWPMCYNWYTFIENNFRWIIFSANMSSTGETFAPKFEQVNPFKVGYSVPNFLILAGTKLSFFRNWNQ